MPHGAQDVDENLIGGSGNWQELNVGNGRGISDAPRWEFIIFPGVADALDSDETPVPAGDPDYPPLAERDPHGPPEERWDPSKHLRRDAYADFMWGISYHEIAEGSKEQRLTLHPANGYDVPAGNEVIDRYLLPDGLIDFGRIANIGEPNSDRREDWLHLLTEANTLLKDPTIDMLTPSEWGIPSAYFNTAGITTTTGERTGQSFHRPDFPAHNDNTARTAYMNAHRGGGDADDPDLFTLSGNSGYHDVSRSIVWRITVLHNAIFGSNINHLSGDSVYVRINRQQLPKLITNVRKGLQAVKELVLNGWASPDQDEINEMVDLEGDAALSEGTTEFVLETLNPFERRALSAEADYQRYFSTTFNKDVIASVPILQNFYLTTKYFQNISDVFVATNNLTLDILLSTIRNADGYKAEPNLSRPATSLPRTGDLGRPNPDDMAGAAKDFILKMLIMTPINILKGLTELIDPHIAISKLIKTGTGFAFGVLETPLGVAAEAINEVRKEMIPTEEEKEAFVGLSGNDLLKLVLCLINMLMEKDAEIDWLAPNGLPYNQQFPPVLPDGTLDGVPDNFLPKITEMGVDFTGTISGLLMIPPSPLGIIYLLLGLIKNKETDTVDNVLDETPVDECADESTKADDDEEN